MIIKKNIVANLLNENIHFFLKCYVTQLCFTMYVFIALTIFYHETISVMNLRPLYKLYQNFKYQIWYLFSDRTLSIFILLCYTVNIKYIHNTNNLKSKWYAVQLNQILLGRSLNLLVYYIICKTLSNVTSASSVTKNHFGINLYCNVQIIFCICYQWIASYFSKWIFCVSCTIHKLCIYIQCIMV